MTNKLFILFPFIWTLYNPIIAQAQEEWQVLVLTNPDVIVADELILTYKKVEEAITTQLVSADIEVSDKSLLQNSANMTDQQLFSLNRDDINLAIRYRLDVNEESASVVKQWHLYLSAYIVDLETKKKIETSSEERLFSGLPSKCDDNCFNLWLAKQAETLAQDLGAVLVEKLNSLPRRYRYEIAFNRFTPNELIQVHDYLKKVDGYVHAKLLEKSATEQQWLHQIEGRKYRYVSHMPADVLDVALQKQLNSIGVPVRNAKNDGRHFVLIRAGIPYLAWYIGTCIALMLFLYSLYAIQVRRKHQLVLSKLVHGRYAQQWLDYYKNMPMFAVPKIRGWHEQEKKLLDDIKNSTELSEQAWLFADQGDYGNAQLKVEQALTINSDNKHAIELKENIVDFQRGYDRYILASKEVITHPEQAIKLLKKAQELNPHLNEKLSRLVKQCDLKIQETKGATVLQQAQGAIERLECYLAYSLIDQFLIGLTPDNIDNKTVTLLTTLRSEIDIMVLPLQGAVTGDNGLSGWHFFTDNKIEVGRKVDYPTKSFAIGYKRISRVGKQCELVRKGSEFYLTDQGSSNGCIYGDLPLTPQQAVKISDNKILVLGAGKAKNTSSAVCQVVFHQAPNSSNALILKLSNKSFQFIDDTNMSTAWPSMEDDIRSRWVLMGELLQIGIDQQGMLDVGCIKGSESVVRLIYQEGFYLQPELGNSMETEIMIEQQPLYGKVPLQEGTCITIGNHKFSFQRVQA